MTPPYVAGRESEQRIALGLLGRLEQGRSSETDLILYGPRGYGKTVLLTWIAREAKAREIESIGITAMEIKSRDTLVYILTPRYSRLEWILDGISGIVSKYRSVPLRPSPREHDGVARALEKQLNRGPVLMGIDEAHVLDTSVGSILLPVVHAKTAPRWCAAPDGPRRNSRPAGQARCDSRELLGEKQDPPSSAT